MTRQAKPDNALGQNLRRVRRALGWSQRDAAEKIGAAVSAPYLCQLEKGRVQSPSLKTCVAIATTYGLSITQLIEWTDSPHQKQPTCPSCGQELDEETRP